MENLLNIPSMQTRSQYMQGDNQITYPKPEQLPAARSGKLPPPPSNPESSEVVQQPLRTCANAVKKTELRPKLDELSETRLPEQLLDNSSGNFPGRAFPFACDGAQKDTLP